MIKHYRSIPINLKLAEGDAPNAAPKEIEIIRVGNFSTPNNGKFEVTTDVLDQFIQNFQARVRGIDLAVDYSHDAEGPAAGWIRDLEIRDNSLWGQIEWTPRADQAIQGKEFRYISADFTFDYQDNESLQSFGPTLFGAALTNRPVVKQMAPVIELTEGKEIPQMDPKDKEIADLKAQLAALQKNAKMGDGGEPDADDAGKGKEMPAVQADDMSMDEMKKKLADLQKQCDDYAMKEKQAAEAQKLAEKKSSFDKLLSEGRAVEAQRESYMSGDAVKFAELSQPIKLSAAGSSNDAPAAAAQNADAQEEVIKLAEVLAKETKVSLSEALKNVLADEKNTALRARYEESVKI